MFRFSDFVCIPHELESPMQQCHQKVHPTGIVYAAVATSTIDHPDMVSRPVLQEAAQDGFAFIPTSYLKLLAEDRASGFHHSLFSQSLLNFHQLVGDSMIHS